jgi:hypothetical protein
MALNHKHDLWTKAGLFVFNNIAALSFRPRMALNPKNGFEPKRSSLFSTKIGFEPHF